MITVKILEDVEHFKHLFTLENDYDFRDDGSIKGEYLVRKGSENARTHFINIIQENSERYENFVYFKEYLEKHPEKIKEYEELKEKLVNIYSEDRKKII